MRLLFALLFLLAGCGATGNGIVFDKPPPLPAPPPKGPSHAATPEVGVISLVSDAMSELQLDAAQKIKLTQLLDALKKKHRAALDARAMLAIDMAHSVESSLVDDRLLALDAENLGRERASANADDGKTLEDLHATLSAEQRKKFAAGLEKKAADLRLDDFMTRWGVWRSDLQVTPEQDARILPKLQAESADAAKAERAEWQKRLRESATAFSGDTFSAKTFVDPDPKATTIARIGRLIRFLAIVVPELTEAQRGHAADFIRAEAGVSVQRRDVQE
jgi:hypothetical protein